MTDILELLLNKYPLEVVAMSVALFGFLVIALRIQKQSTNESEAQKSNAEVAKQSTIKAFELMALLKTTTDQLRETETRIARLEASVATLQHEDAAKTEKIIELNNEIMSLKAQVKALLGDVEQKEQENKLLTARVKMLEQKVKYLEQLLREHNIEFSYEREGI